MIVVDSGGTATPPTDIIDGGDTSTPPTDIYDSQYVLGAQVVSTGTSVVTPTFTGVDINNVVLPDTGLVLYVKVGGTTTAVTVVIPGNQPYTGAARDDLVASGLTNTERVFVLPPVLLTDPTNEVISVSYSATTGVTAALLKVN